ncbi:MAG: hypothetical protein EXR75_16815 [Myxococcales bacterium]|nr:hypothetical protein [Myxococcales bacterium]
MNTPRPRLRFAAEIAVFAVISCTILIAAPGSAQPAAAPNRALAAADPNHGHALPRPTVAPDGSVPITEDWVGAVRVLRVPGAGATGIAEAAAATEIFPDADKAWMHVVGTDARPIEAARRGARAWICTGGCELTTPGGAEANGAGLLQSIKLQTPMQPLPLTVWQPDAADPTGKLLFDPRLLGRRSYRHQCAYPPVAVRARVGDEVAECRDRGTAEAPTSDSAELFLGLRWPDTSELARFQYLAIADACGNTRVQPFQRTVTVPVVLVASGGCEQPDGRILRIFPGGGFVRATAFNLDSPAAGSVVSATFRVSLPPLEDMISPEPPPLLFPDPRLDELIVDCGPLSLKPAASPSPTASPAPGSAPVAAAPRSPVAVVAATDALNHHLVKGARLSTPATSTKQQPLAHQHLVIAPEPMQRGNCRLELRGQTKRRLIAPLALRVVLRRTDKASDDGTSRPLFEGDWVVTPTDSIFRLPPLAFDGESRLLLEVYSNPMSPLGNVVLVSDAARYLRRELRGTNAEQLVRLIGSVTIHTAPLCGESNFETAESAGSCVRGYFTLPAMLATLQVTRAPWAERPLITRSVLSAVGIAFALDSYDPVERKAFPVALQLGGFVQDLGDQRLGLMSYIGIAPTLPVLGAGGNTTSLGLLAGLGMTYITRATGPDEGFKPSAFLSVVVQVGQASPTLSGGSPENFGN